MKEITVEQLSSETPALLSLAQTERVIVTRNGKPLALLLGLEYKDEEDYALEKDTEFWQMIQERRKGTKTVPLAEVKKQLGLSQPKRRKTNEKKR
jgi:antitoxin (DNA-binding transcriptional repressor) of toxin-antitoxin stability system